MHRLFEIHGPYFNTVWMGSGPFRPIFLKLWQWAKKYPFWAHNFSAFFDKKRPLNPLKTFSAQLWFHIRPYSSLMCINIQKLEIYWGAPGGSIWHFWLAGIMDSCFSRHFNTRSGKLILDYFGAPRKGELCHLRGWGCFYLNMIVKEKRRLHPLFFGSFSQCLPVGRLRFWQVWNADFGYHSTIIPLSSSEESTGAWWFSWNHMSRWRQIGR